MGAMTATSINPKTNPQIKPSVTLDMLPLFVCSWTASSFEKTYPGISPPSIYF